MNARLLIYCLAIVFFIFILDQVSRGAPYVSSPANVGKPLQFPDKSSSISIFPDSTSTFPRNNPKDSLPKSLSHANAKIEADQMPFEPGFEQFIYDDTIKNKGGLNTIKEKAANNFITRNLLSILVPDSQDSRKKLEVNSTLYFEPYANRKIASIRIKQLDVFGPTFQDTTLIAKEWLTRTANSLHVKTVERKLRNQLLFSVGEKVRPVLMADNEKIIRDLPYIRDVAITITPSKHFPDEVDVLVLIKERFEYGFVADINPPVSQFEIYDDNMFGIGHQFSVKLVNHQDFQPKWGGELAYSLSDIAGKFVNGSVGLINTYRKSSRNMALEKKFVSTDVKNAGGVYVERTYRDNYITPYNIARLDTAVSYLYTDYWYAHALSIYRKSSYLGNAVISGRYYRQHYFSSFGISPNSMIRNHDFILSTLGFSKRNLYKTNLIYGYGITEDVPYGQYFEISAGMDFTSYGNRPYSHILYSKANVFKNGGYFNWLVGIGGYLQNSTIEQGAFTLNLDYFSNLVFINGKAYRNFINLDLLSGINRFKDEYLSINRKFGIRDFYSLNVKGTNRLKINMESVHFIDRTYHGFRFAQYFYADCAFLSNSINRLFSQDFYAGIGIGLRVHNESLVFKVFELRFTWFPIVPANQNIVYLNAFTESKTQFDDFLGRKPEEITFK